MSTLAAAKSPANVRRFRRMQWQILLAAMFCYLFFYTGRQTFGFAIPGIQAELGLSKQTLGWVSAGMLWCYAIGQAINGNLADKYGGRKLMSAGALLSCAANWLVSFASGFKSLLLPWCLNGYFQAFGWAPGSRLLSNWWASSERGKVYGFYVTAASCASILSFATSIVVVGVLQLDWRWIFRLPVLLMLLGGVAFYLLVRERPADLGFTAPAQSSPSQTGAEPQSTENQPEESSSSRYKAVLSDVRLWFAGISVGFMNAARYGLIVWVPVHYLGMDWKTSSSLIDPKWISLALPLGMALGTLCNGWISDRLFASKRSPAIMLFMFCATAACVAMYLIPTSVLAIVMLFVSGFFVFGPASSFWALCPDLVGTARSGTATGVLNAFAYLFAGLGEPLIGWLLDLSGNTALVFFIVALSCLGSAISAWFIRR